MPNDKRIRLSVASATVLAALIAAVTTIVVTLLNRPAVPVSLPTPGPAAIAATPALQPKPAAFEPAEPDVAAPPKRRTTVRAKPDSQVAAASRVSTQPAVPPIVIKQACVISNATINSPTPQDCSNVVQ